MSYSILTIQHVLLAVGPVRTGVLYVHVHLSRVFWAITGELNHAGTRLSEM